MLKRFAAVILFLLPIHAYAQVGPGPVPYRGVNNWPLIFGTDNTYDIGAVGASRPRNIYAGTAGFFPALTVSGLTSTRVPVAGVGGLFGDFSTFTFNSGTGTVSATNFAASSGVTAASVTDSGLTSGRITQAGTAGLLQDDADLTFSGSRLTATDLTVTNFPTFSAGTNTRVPFFGASGVVTDDADLTFATDTLSSTRLLLGAGTVGSPGWAWTADADGTGTGMYRNGANFIAVSLNGVDRGMFIANGYQMRSDGSVEWCATTSIACGPDTTLRRVSAGVVRLSNATAAQTFALLGGGANVASATALAVPVAGVYHVTGTTNITSITSTNIGTGTCITLIFDGALTFTDGSNLVLAGNFVTTADDTIGLCYDGTNWYETHRSVN